VLGVLRRYDHLVTPSRHLGLVPAAERRAEAVAAVDAMADVMAESLDLDALVQVARSAPPLRSEAWRPWAPWSPRRAAVFGGAAFTFGYAEHVEMLAAGGTEVAVVDPLHDEALPAGIDLLVLGGGFPEVYAADLSANQRLRASVAAYDGSVLAECAGLLYLCRELDGLPMAGILDAEATMTGSLTLGYREATAATASLLGPPGRVLRGHEFHRTAVTPGAGSTPAWRWGRRGRDEASPVTEGYVVRGGRVHASYLHTHWAGLAEAGTPSASSCPRGEPAGRRMATWRA
jgi:cobyrinic acid a,c-diamide synthase